jgi:hypothetical protein
VDGGQRDIQMIGIDMGTVRIQSQQLIRRPSSMLHLQETGLSGKKASVRHGGRSGYYDLPTYLHHPFITIS